MKKTLLLSFFFLQVIWIHAQDGTVRGTIYDKNDKTPVSFCNVLLLDDSNSVQQGAISEENGAFIFKNIQQGTYSVMVQSLTHDEYKSSTFSISEKTQNVTLDSLLLQSASIQFEEIEIVSDRSAVKIEPAKKTFNLEKTGTETGGTVTEALNNLPSVDVDQDGNISLRGNSNLRILIDGKPAGFDTDDITLILSQLPANSVESIEVITVPSAKYDPEGVGGIINIILKKEKKAGVNGNMNVAYALDDKVNLSTGLTFRKNKFSIDANYSLKTGEYWSKSETNSSTVVSDSLTLFDVQSNTDRQSTGHTGKIGFDYEIDKNLNINAEVGANIMNYDRSGTTNFDWNYNNENTNQYNRYVTSLRDRDSYNAQAGFNGIIGTTKIDGFSRYQYGLSSEDGIYVESVVNQEEIRNFVSDEWNHQLDMTTPFSTMSKDSVLTNYVLESGIKVTSRSLFEEYSLGEFSPTGDNYIINENYSNELNYNEDVYAGYLVLNYDKNKIKANLGLRAEYATIFSEVKDNKFERTLLNFFPSFSVVKEISEFKNLSFSYSKRIRRPQARQLNPIASRSNPYNLHIGNAELLPEQSHIGELSFTQRTEKHTLSSTLFYQYRQDRMGRLSYTDSSGVSTIQWINFNYHQTLGLEVYSNYKFHPDFSLNSSATFYKTWVDGENFRSGFITEYFGFDLKSNLSWTPIKSTTFTISGIYNSRRLAVVGVVLPRYGIDASVKKQFWKNKAFITLRLTDVFRTRGFWIDVDVDNWIRKVEYRYESQILWIGLGYNFGTKMSSKRTKKSDEQKDRGNDDL